MASPASPTRVAVLLPVKAAPADYLAQAVESVLGQSHQALQLWVIEAESAVPAADVLARYRDERIRHVRLPRETNLVEQLNEGLRLIDTELVARMDADDVCHPERIARQLVYMQANPAIDVVGCQLRVINEAGQVLGERRYPCAPADVAAALRRFNALPHPGVMFRRQAIIDAGGYCFPGRPVQDYELWSRMAVAGRQLANLDEVLLDYRLHGGSVKGRNLRATLRATLAVKQLHWRRRMTLGDRCRMWAETAALALPARLVSWAFMKSQLRRVKKDHAKS